MTLPLLCYLSLIRKIRRNSVSSTSFVLSLKLPPFGNGFVIREVSMDDSHQLLGFEWLRDRVLCPHQLTFQVICHAIRPESIIITVWPHCCSAFNWRDIS